MLCTRYSIQAVCSVYNVLCIMYSIHLTSTLTLISTGFIHCVQELRKGTVPALYDMTLGYPKTLPHRGEMDILTGTFPEEVIIATVC